ncbi:Cytochrome monooxygenase FUM15 like protein [Verticillium longisporum]|nr:Cytochrome monooxygenase FUM15 like protein [Verticillium longisporum]
MVPDIQRHRLLDVVVLAPTHPGHGLVLVSLLDQHIQVSIDGLSLSSGGGIICFGVSLILPSRGVQQGLEVGLRLIRLADGSSHCVDGTILYNCHTLIQRDEAVYGPTVNDFVPERWLGNTSTSVSNDDEEDTNDAEKATIGKASESDIPVSAWRPFERGPRNCIGQELANIEARIILATVVVKYDFVKVGMAEAKLGQDGKPLLDDKGQHVSDTQLFSDRQITARPNDGIKVRVKLREGLRP